jgi:hypothetical protein
MSYYLAGPSLVLDQISQQQPGGNRAHQDSIRAAKGWLTDRASVATPTFVSVIPGRRSEAEANPESIPTVEIDWIERGLWIPGSG